jgi:septum formation protein
MAGESLVAETLVLASGSRFRAALLRNAGVDFTVDAAAVDEGAIRDAMRAEGSPVEDVAEVLAETKAITVSRRHPDALVLGSDQMLDVDGRWLEKPVDRAHARAHLELLSGKTHRLVTSAVIIRGGTRIWHVMDDVELTMRALSAEFIEDYLDQVGDGVSETVGAYQLEGLGGQLFTAVRGDYFTVLGLPLLPILGFLRQRGVLAT